MHVATLIAQDSEGEHLLRTWQGPIDADAVASEADEQIRGYAEEIGSTQRGRVELRDKHDRPLGRFPFREQPPGAEGYGPDVEGLIRQSQKHADLLLQQHTAMVGTTLKAMAELVRLATERAGESDAREQQLRVDMVALFDRMLEARAEAAVAGEEDGQRDENVARLLGLLERAATVAMIPRPPQKD